MTDVQHKLYICLPGMHKSHRFQCNHMSQPSCENHRIRDKLRFRRQCQANCFAEPRQLNVGVGPECIPVRYHIEVLSPAAIGNQRLYLDGERRGVGGQRRVVSMFCFVFFISSELKTTAAEFYSRKRVERELVAMNTPETRAPAHTHTRTCTCVPAHEDTQGSAYNCPNLKC